MKFKLHFLIVVFALLFSEMSFAQVNRNVAPGQYRMPKPKTGKVDYVEQTVAYYTKELTLDDFQAAAVKEIINEEKDNISAMREQTDATLDEKRDRSKAINDRIDTKIKAILSPDQLKKYEDMIAKRKY